MVCGATRKLNPARERPVNSSSSRKASGSSCWAWLRNCPALLARPAWESRGGRRLREPELSAAGRVGRDRGSIWMASPPRGYAQLVSVPSPLGSAAPSRLTSALPFSPRGSGRDRARAGWLLTPSRRKYQLNCWGQNRDESSEAPEISAEIRMTAVGSLGWVLAGSRSTAFGAKPSSSKHRR